MFHFTFWLSFWNLCCLLLGYYYDTIHRHTHIHTHTLFPGLPGWASTRKVKPIWILPKQETVSGSGISWTICKTAPHSRQITTPAPHHSVFYRPDALPVAQPTVSKHWRHTMILSLDEISRLPVRSTNAVSTCIVIDGKKYQVPVECFCWLQHQARFISWHIKTIDKLNHFQNFYEKKYPADK